MTKALCELGLPVVAVLSDQIENLSFWKHLPLEKLILIPTYHNIAEAVKGTLFFSFKQKKTIKAELSMYNIKYIYCPMGAFWSNAINKIFPNATTGIVIHDPTPHSGDKLKSIFLKDYYPEYDFLFVHSKQFVDYVRRKYNKPTSFIQLGNHDIYKYCENKINVIDYNPNKINYLFFGRISKYKGLDILGKAFKKLYNDLGDTVTLNIIGSGDFSPYSELYKSLPNATIINRWIKDEETESAFVGNNLICVCPYIDATQSGVCIVAMDYGVPIIATKTGGLEEQIVDGDTGLLVSPSNVDELYKAMLRLAEDKSLRNHIISKQKETMATMGWDVSAKQLIEAMKINL